MLKNPRAFISYSWSSETHQQWVLDLATQLRENGVDVTIDKWDLKEGNDAIVFMEKMVTDPDIKKVIMVLDRKYAEKADKKEGGVGTESQIISPEIYAKTDQGKFVGVTSEVDADGRPFLPTFYRSRIYIDLSSADIFAQNFDQLLRWIYDRPAFPKPGIGKAPEFLNQTAVLLPTRTRARRAVDLLRSGAPSASGAISEYFNSLSDSFENLRLQRVKDRAFDDLVLESISSFVPYRDEFIEVISSVARFSPSDENVRLVHRFFERLIPYLSRPKDIRQWSEEDFDNFKFLVHELFLYTVAIFLKHERFDAVAALISVDYFVGNAPDYVSVPMQSFGVFRAYLESLAHRKKRLALTRLSLRADLLKERSEASGFSLSDLMQADFVLFLKDAVTALASNKSQEWWPETLVWLNEYAGPFEIFARAESVRYFNKIKVMFGFETKDDLVKLLPNFGYQNSLLYLPRWEFRSFSVKNAANVDKLASKP